MTRSDIAKWWMTLIGLLMAGIGVLAMIDRRLIVSDRQLVGRQSDAILSIGDTHGAFLVGAGLLAILIGLALWGRMRATATLGYGILALVGFALVMASTDLWGRLDVPANNGVQILYLAIGVISLAAGALASSAAPRERYSGPGLIHGAPTR
ncbi:MAG: hypothetical protein EPO16_06825 [Dehalococcoidia bacterium]|nr:MAG: hypothetical protein EPO16_06825 [Dehalococcoidia bacterium]